MEGGNRRRWPSWNNLKRHLRWNRINFLGCCGSSNWVLDNINHGEHPLLIPEDQSPELPETITQESCLPDDQIPSDTTTMNLATALAADRRQTNIGPTDGMMLKSIVRLFEEIDGREVVKVAADRRGGIGSMCCLCTERNKGAALIPCGHTYCRACSRAMWLKHGSCPLCSRLITEVLEIF